MPCISQCITPKVLNSQVDLEGKMSGDVPQCHTKVRNGLSVRRLGGVVGAPHVARYIHVPACTRGGGGKRKLRPQTAHAS